jgi:hypothetical protein
MENINLKKVVKLAYRTWLDTGAAFLGPCGGQDDKPAEPRNDGELIGLRGIPKERQKVEPKIRRESFFGL